MQRPPPLGQDQRLLCALPWSPRSRLARVEREIASDSERYLSEAEWSERRPWFRELAWLLWVLNTTSFISLPPGREDAELLLPESRGTLLALPDDILITLISNMPMSSRLVIEGCSRRIGRLCRHPRLWRDIRVPMEAAMLLSNPTLHLLLSRVNAKGVTASFQFESFCPHISVISLAPLSGSRELRSLDLSCLTVQDRADVYDTMFIVKSMLPPRHIDTDRLTEHDMCNLEELKLPHVQLRETDHFLTFNEEREWMDNQLAELQQLVASGRALRTVSRNVCCSFCSHLMSLSAAPQDVKEVALSALPCPMCSRRSCCAPECPELHLCTHCDRHYCSICEPLEHACARCHAQYCTSCHDDQCTSCRSCSARCCCGVWMCTSCSFQFCDDCLDEFFLCHICKQDVCADCIHECIGCHQLECSACGVHTTCPTCGQSTCQDCNVCCDKCSLPLCPQCTEYCAECDIWLCSCAEQLACSVCDSRVSEQCVQRCSTCEHVACHPCWHESFKNCMLCDEQFCERCYNHAVTSCGSCGLDLCASCRSESICEECKNSFVAEVNSRCLCDIEFSHLK